MLPLRGLKVEGSIVNGPELKGDCEMVNVGKKLEKKFWKFFGIRFITGSLYQFM